MTRIHRLLLEAMAAAVRGEHTKWEQLSADEWT